MGRFSSLFRLQDFLYTTGSPVVIVAGALLKDNETNKVFAQIKYTNITPKDIKAVKVSIDAFDVTKSKIISVSDHQYLDLTVGRDGEFGEKTVVALPDITARSFNVKIISVIFSDGTSWFALDTAQWKPLPSQPTLKDHFGNERFSSQYVRETNSAAKFIPIESDDVWLCSCGAINRIGEENCHQCWLSLSKQKSLLSTEELSPGLAEYEKSVADRAWNQAEEERKRKDVNRAIQAKKKRLAAILIPIAVVLIAMVAVFATVIHPANQYDAALALLDNKQYEEAILAFDELKFYKDAVQKATEAQELLQKQKEEEQLLVKQRQEEERLQKLYQQANALLDAEKYTEALTAFGELGEYSDSKARVMDIYQTWYQKAETLQNNGDYSGAAVLFALAAPYSDSQERYNDLMVNHAIWGIDTGGRNVVAWGPNGIFMTSNDEYGQRRGVTNWEDIVQIASAPIHTFGLHKDGTVSIAGGDKGYYMKVPSDSPGVVGIEAGFGTNVLLRQDGTVDAYHFDFGQYTSGWSKIIMVSSSGYHILGLRSDGKVVSTPVDPTAKEYGFDFGQAKVSSWRNIVAISAGSYHSVGLQSDGTVVSTKSPYGASDVSEWKDIVAIATGECHTVGLRSDGTVVATKVSKENDYGQCDVSGWTDIIAIAASSRITVGIKKDGTVVAAGELFDYSNYDDLDKEVSDWDLW